MGHRWEFVVLANGVWRNLHSVPTTRGEGVVREAVYEVRVAEGYGARWAQRGGEGRCGDRSPQERGGRTEMVKAAAWGSAGGVRGAGLYLHHRPKAAAVLADINKSIAAPNRRQERAEKHKQRKNSKIYKKI